MTSEERREDSQQLLKEKTCITKMTTHQGHNSNNKSINKT